MRDEVVSLLETHHEDGLLGTLDEDSLSPVGPDQLQLLQDGLADRYTVGRPLGAGGMATVYLAEDLRHQRKVAIKVLSPEFSATLGADRFLREISIAARLRHPHILPLYDSGSIDNVLYYVMPVEAESLRHRLVRDRTVMLDDAIRITLEVLDGLDYAHAEGVVHRDIKPENILLSRGHAIIADFGIARAISKAGGVQLTQAGLPIGTPAYMSPEQLLGDPRVDGRSDIYSVGCVLCEMLTGVAPLPGRATQGFDLETLSGIVPKNVADAICKALAPECDARFDTGAEFAHMLTSTSGQTSGFEQEASESSRSIAVLPFTNMSTDPDNEYFSDGMTEEVINALTQLKGLRVAARTSSFVFKDKTVDVSEIGAKLKVATVLEGSVRKVGNRLRITAQLINVADGYHLWSERYDRNMDDIFEVQDEIARTIAERLKITLTAQEGEQLVKPPTKDIDAYQLYLKGRHVWNRRSKSALEQAAEYFEEAIERDENFASAYAGLADAYLLLGSYHYMPHEEAISKAKAAVERALQLDDALAEAHASRGQVLRSEMDWNGERAEYLRAIELNPSYATAHQWYATLLAALGRSDEALREIRLAEELDPLSHAISVTVVVVLFLARKFDEALEQLDKTLELEPNFASAHAWRGILYATVGRHDEVPAAVERAAQLAPDNPNVWIGLGYSYATTGQREKAIDIIDQAHARGAVGWTALIWAALGENDKAFECLEQQLLASPSWNSLIYFRGYPWFDPLRSDPRFEQIERQMKLTE